jgi:hypothetical protein
VAFGTRYLIALLVHHQAKKNLLAPQCLSHRMPPRVRNIQIRNQPVLWVHSEKMPHRIGSTGFRILENIFCGIAIKGCKCGL